MKGREKPHVDKCRKITNTEIIMPIVCLRHFQLHILYPWNIGIYLQVCITLQLRSRTTKIILFQVFHEHPLVSDYCSDSFMYNDTMTNNASYQKNGTHELNGSGIYSSNIESLSSVINDNYSDFRYVNLNFVYQSDRQTSGYSQSNLFLGKWKMTMFLLIVWNVFLIYNC